MASIVIDPGHGGSETIPGDSTWNNAVGPNGTLEKNLTLDVGLRVHEALVGAGHDVRLTRDTDVNLRLRERAKVAHAFEAHAFVSIHFNGSQNHNAQGTETLVHTNHSQASARLSLAVQDALLPVTGLTDRNKTFNQATRIKPQSLGVLRPDFHHPSTAACLAEVSFLDRADEEERLQAEDYRQDIARVIAAGIESFTGAATVSVPVGKVDAGDAIELAMLEEAGAEDVEAFLGLDQVQPATPAVAADDSVDVGEAIARPAGAFSKEFVENVGPPLALIMNEPQWPDLGEFLNFFDTLGLRFFTADELLFMGASNKSGPCKGKNAFPPKDLWNNIVNTVQMLDAIRNELGAPIRTLSCYRSPEYNSCVGGAGGSLHLKFNAIDFTCSQGTPEIWRRVASRIRGSQSRFVGGIGVYPNKKFVHIDTRGTAADWLG